MEFIKCLIKDLKSEEKELQDKLFANHQSQFELNKNAFLEKWGFKVGDEVKYLKDGKNLTYAQISGIETAPTYVKRYFVHLQKKGGLYRQQHTRLWEYELKTMIKI